MIESDYQILLEQGLVPSFTIGQTSPTQVRCLETLQLFDSLTEAGLSIKNNKNAGKLIGQACIGHRHSAYGLHWMYETDYQKVLITGEAIVIPKYTKPAARAVLCVETGIAYPSLTKAEEELKIDRHRIKEACDNPEVTAGNYHWITINIKESERQND